MKNLMTVLILSVAALGSSAFANTHKEAPDMGKGAASAPMGMGAASAPMGKTAKKPAHAASGAVVAASGSPQQNKMKACNADPIAKSTKGAERKAFMKECLSK